MFSLYTFSSERTHPLYEEGVQAEGDISSLTTAKFKCFGLPPIATLNRYDCRIGSTTKKARNLQEKNEKLFALSYIRNQKEMSFNCFTGIGTLN
jgi:hypothetical protein